VGVPHARQQKALRIFQEGNDLFDDSQNAAAAAKYRAALEVWDHPAIHYNLAVTLIHLDQPLGAFGELERALAFGEAAIGAEEHKQALLLRKLLLGRLATIEVSCDEPGAEVTLDGRPLFVGPGQAHEQILPGPHELVARKKGLLPDTRALTLLPGKLERVRMAPQPLSLAPTRTVRRFAAWKPWTVLVAGVAVAALGAPLLLDARTSFGVYDAEVVRNCPQGCFGTMSPVLQSAYTRGTVEYTAALGAFVAGGVVAAVGLILAVANVPHVERPPAALAFRDGLRF
jgi:hypothetical protein